MAASDFASLVLEFARAEQAGDPFGFRFASQNYLLRTPGGGFEESRFAWDEQLLADLQAVRSPGRDPALLPKIGDQLRRFLLPLGWPEQESQLLAAVAAHRPVVLTIRSAAAELFALPWELVLIKSTGQHLGELPGVLLRQEWPDTHSAAAAARGVEGGRILLVWSAAGGAVPAVEHQQAIAHACQAGYHPFDAARDVLSNASCGKLTRALDEAGRSGAPIAVLHLLCHGTAIGNTYGLALDGEDPPGGPALLDAGRLRQLLAPYAEMVRLVVLCACDSGNSGALGNQLGSVAQTLHRIGIPAVVASRFPLSVSGSIRLTEVIYQELLATPASLERALLSARQRVAEDAAQLDWASLELYARSADGVDSRPIAFRPYRGLQSFGPEHRRFFFGRDRESAELVERLRTLRQTGQPRILAVDGASASGKSSVILAGAMAELLRLHGEGAVLVRRQLGSTPTQMLAGLPTDRPMLLFLDPLDELFTLTPSTPDGRQERNQFVRKLWTLCTAAAPAPDVSVVLTIRSDLQGRCGELVLEDGRTLDSVLYQSAHRCSIPQLARAQLRDVIERPAAVVGLELAPGLCERMLSDVETEPGALPLLADALDSLWLDRRGRALTQESYDALGGIGGALTGRAEQLIASLSPEELRVARRLLFRLVAIGEDGGERSRQRVALSAARPSGADAERFDSVLARLVAARLIVRGQGPQANEESIELVHEVLLRRWQRLRDWLDAEKDWLQKQARLSAWARERSEHGTLLRGHQLDAALEMVQGHEEDLSAAVQQLLADSKAERAREDELARLARDSRRVLLAQQLDFDPTRAVTLLREVESTDPTRVSGWLSQVTNILHRECLTLCELVGHKAGIILARFLPDGSQAITASDDGTLRLWNPQDGTAGASIPLPGGRVLDVGVGAAGQPPSLATAAADQAVKLWTVAMPAGRLAPGPSISTGVAIAVAAFSPDCRTIALGARSGEVFVAPTDGSADPTALNPPKGKGSAGKAAVSALCFSTDGRYLVAAARDGNVRLWDLRNKEAPRSLMEPANEEDADDDEDTSAPMAVAFHPSGSHIAIGQELGGVRVVRKDGTLEPLVLGGHDYRVTSLSFSPDGQLLMSTSTDGSAALWGFCAPTRRATLSGHRGEVNHAAFSADGKWIISSGTDGCARIWDLARAPLSAATRLAPEDKIPPGFVRCFWRSDSDTKKEYRNQLRSADSRDGQRNAKSDATGAVTVSGPGRPAVTLPKDGGPVTALGFSPDGSRLAVAKRDRVIRIFELASGQVTQLAGHHDECYSLDFSPDGTLLATASLDFTVRLWRVAQGGVAILVLVHDGALTLVRFAKSGGRLLTASESDGLWLWESDGTRLPLFDADREEYCLAVRDDLGACITEDTNADGETPDEGERFVWPLDQNPKSLIARLWRATPISLSVEERCQLLGESAEEAARKYQLSLARVREAAAATEQQLRKRPDKAQPSFSWDGPEHEEADA